MKKNFVVLALSGVMTVSGLVGGANAQQHKHEEAVDEKTPTDKSTKTPAKTEPMKCCEGMEKMGDIKGGGPTKAEMKAKMEKMKAEMKQKMAEKHSSDSGDSKAEKQPPAAETQKGEHQH